MALKPLDYLAKHKHLLALDWHKGFLIVGYFLLLVLVETFTTGDWAFAVLAWPVHLLPYRVPAAILQLLFVYVLAVAIDALWLHRQYHKKK